MKAKAGIRTASYVTLVFLSACRAMCQRSPPQPVAFEGGVGDAARPVLMAHGAEASTDAPLGVADSGIPGRLLVSPTAALSFDPTGRKLRVMSDALRIYRVEGLALEAEHPFSGGIVSAGRDVLLVVHYEEGGDEQSYALVDMPTGKTSQLPDAWFARKGEGLPWAASMSERGDRVASAERELGHVSATIYDTNTRQRITTLTADVGMPPRGLFYGEITADGRAVKWCHTRSSMCHVFDLDGGFERDVGRHGATSAKWSVEVPLDDEAQQLKPLRVRDESRRIVGKVDVPLGPLDEDPLTYAVAICAGANRAVIVHDSTLFVVRLPDGKRLHTKAFDVVREHDAQPPVVACAPGGARAAILLPTDSESPIPLIIEQLPP